MIYKIRFSNIALKNLKKLDSTSRAKILKYIDGILARVEDPRLLGKALSGNLGEFWRYRTGNFRIICKIEDKELIVLVLKISHRKDVYL